MTDTMISFAPSRLSTWAPAAPLLCAVHCVAAPLLVTLLPSLNLGEGLEWWLFAAVLPIAVGVLVAELRVHRHRRIPVVVAAGAALWAASLAGWLEPAPETVTTTLGSLIVAGAMVWSARLRHAATCRDCGCPSPVHDPPTRGEAA